MNHEQFLVFSSSSPVRTQHLLISLSQSVREGLQKSKTNLGFWLKLGREGSERAPGAQPIIWASSKYALKCCIPII